MAYFGKGKKQSTNTDYADDIALPANTSAQAESLLHCQERATGSIGLYANVEKTKFMCFNQRGAISTLNGRSLKLVADLSVKIKQFFPSSGRVTTTVWMQTKFMEQNIGNCTRMLQAVLNKSWRQHPTKQQLYCHLPSISKTIQIRRIKHVGHCWRSKNELISEVLLWGPSRGRAKVGRSARIYLQQLCAIQDIA